MDNHLIKVEFRTFCIMDLQGIILIVISRNLNELKFNCLELIFNCCNNF